MKILAIETSCDETSAAVIQDGQTILSNIVSSQIPLHSKYGGVIPEIAARAHVGIILPVIEEALSKAKLGLEEIDALAVTMGPGLIGSLIVGTETARTIAILKNKPIVSINHLAGHIYANWLGKSNISFPVLA
jgi:N6-L-threonylcarbamoyladenine synthase